MNALAPNYKRKNLSFVSGKGSFLIATNGKKYLDFVQGIAVNSLGHSNEKLIKAITYQSKKLWHVSNAFKIPEGEKLANRLVKKLLQTQSFSKIVVQKPPKQPLKLLEDIFIQLEKK